MKGKRLTGEELTAIEEEYKTTELNDAELIVISKQHFDDLINSNKYLTKRFYTLRERNQELSERVSKAGNEISKLKKGKK